MHTFSSLVWAVLLGLAAGLPLHAQERVPPAVPAPGTPRATGLDSLVRLALSANPAIRAAESRVRAAEAAVGPAGARPDLMLMAGLVNFPIADPGFDDFMTMKMIGVSQTFPYPGKLGLRTRAAHRMVSASEARLDQTRRGVIRDVKQEYYELALTDRLLEIVGRNHRVLLDLTRATEASYQVGRAGQEDLLRARIEVVRLGEEAAALRERRREDLARLNALLDRPGETPIEGEPRIPRRLVHAAVADSATAIRFISMVPGSRAADSPLPPLAELQDVAIRQNPMLRAHEAGIAAQAARLDLARKAHLPDFDVSLQFAQRSGFPDMVSATVSIPVPLQKGRTQDQFVTEAEADLAALEAGHDAIVNEIRAQIAGLYGDAERDRAQLALYVKAILPQGRAALASSTSGFQVGRTDLLTLLDAQTTLFTYETRYFRVLTDFAKSVAELEAVVGQEILP